MSLIPASALEAISGNLSIAVLAAYTAFAFQPVTEYNSTTPACLPYAYDVAAVVSNITGTLDQFSPIPYISVTPIWVSEGVDDGPSWYTIFGFTATTNFASTAEDKQFNILALRGTASYAESTAIVDAMSGGYPFTSSQILFPSDGSNPQTKFGRTSVLLWDWYSLGQPVYFETCKGQVLQNFNQSVRIAFNAINSKYSKRRWYMAAHSLGGGLATLAAADLQSTNPKAEMALLTFGSMAVGDVNFSLAYNKIAGQSLGLNTYRFANEADFVPSLRGLLPDQAPPYQHVGQPMLFLWQTDNNWASHSMQNIYSTMVTLFWDLIVQITPLYPTSIGRCMDKSQHHRTAHGGDAQISLREEL